MCTMYDVTITLFVTAFVYITPLIRRNSKKYDQELYGFALGDFTDSKLEQLVKLSQEAAGKLLILIDIVSTNEDYLQKV